MPAAEDLTKAATALQSLLRKPSSSARDIQAAISSGKKTLLTHNLLLPNAAAPPPAHAAARFILEASALLSIRSQDEAGFVRYQAALGPFYELPAAAYPDGEARGQRAKVTGLYLLFLLTKGDYAGFHTLIEGLEAESAEEDRRREEEEDEEDEEDSDDSDEEEEESVIEDDNVRYPIALERFLMEGSYNRVWDLAKSERLPSEEAGLFSTVLVDTIRDQIASCSEKAYPSIPVTNAKNLLFLGSEGEVVQFAHKHGWTVRDGRIYFPHAGDELAAREDREILEAGGQVIENTIGYARELETIV